MDHLSDEVKTPHPNPPPGVPGGGDKSGLVQDTIVAISSAVGAAARVIVRVSGPLSWGLAESLCRSVSLVPASAKSTLLSLGRLTIPVTLYSFQSPRSYTGEDQVEFHVPGNPLLVRMLLEALIAGGARQAEAGEFTARAYFHGRLDLTEAEGVAATIAAHSERELSAARKLLSGELARRLKPAMELVAQTLALVEVGIDFTEEDVSFLTGVEIAGRIQHVDEMLREIVGQSARFERLTHEPRAVLLGRPNAGKSTLLNALSGRDRAVVSSVAGTTRDAVSTEIALAHGMIRLVDVAGIEGLPAELVNGMGNEASITSQFSGVLGATGLGVPRPVAPNPNSEIARQMQDRALREVEAADLVLLLHDASSNELPMTPMRSPHLVVYTKCDLVTGVTSAGSSVIHISAHTGENLDVLRRRLDELAFGAAPTEGTLALNARHLQALADARAALTRAADLVSAGSELLALELRETLDALGSILGNVSPDDVLTRVFSAFCIGK